MTDDEMQALRDIEACPTCCETLGRPLVALGEAINCDTCLRLVADAVLQQTRDRLIAELKAIRAKRENA